MGKIAFLFSGQGAQYPGMGKSLAEADKAAYEVFAYADQARPGTSSQCFTGPKEELDRTINTQPCVYCVDLAAAEALRNAGIVPDAVAGFSLGEIAALTFSGAVEPKIGFELVCSRASFMQDAAEKTDGAMAAVLKLSHEEVQQLASSLGNVYPVNFNCPGQVAVATEASALEPLCKEVQEAGGRAVPLAVSGAFHSPFMDSAAAQLAELLENLPVAPPKIPLYSNCTGELYEANVSRIRELLALQVNHPVWWQKILEHMAGSGIDTFIEVGPGKTLSGFVKKTLPGVSVYRVEDAETLKSTIEALKQA